MKKRFCLMVTFIIILMIYIRPQNHKRQLFILSYWVTKNVEALASNEGSSNYVCIGEGSIDCPNDTRANKVYIFLP